MTWHTHMNKLISILGSNRSSLNHYWCQSATGEANSQPSCSRNIMQEKYWLFPVPMLGLAIKAGYQGFDISNHINTRDVRMCWSPLPRAWDCQMEGQYALQCWEVRRWKALPSLLSLEILEPNPTGAISEESATQKPLLGSGILAALSETQKVQEGTDERYSKRLGYPQTVWDTMAWCTQWTKGVQTPVTLWSPRWVVCRTCTSWQHLATHSYLEMLCHAALWSMGTSSCRCNSKGPFEISTAAEQQGVNLQSLSLQKSTSNQTSCLWGTTEASHLL